MTRCSFEFYIDEYPELPTVLPKYIYYAEQIGIFLDSNRYPLDKYSRYSWLAAWKAHRGISSNNMRLGDLFEFHQHHKDWLLGHFNYNLKNQLEKLTSFHKDIFNFPLFNFFIPDTIVYRTENIVRVESYSIVSKEVFFNTIRQVSLKDENEFDTISQLEAKTSRKNYINSVNCLLEELQFGNIYEINYCIEFWAKHRINPFKVFEKLNDLSQAPFSAFYKLGNNYLLCGSPERYLQKTAERVISQPIKGTARRSSHMEENKQLVKALSRDKKERAENVMTVDLVRNDLSRTAQKNSVQVEELFEVYTFKNVHQLISTVSSKLKVGYNFLDLIKTSFPMGSMTGTPKVKAMELIDRYENFNRSLYSGSVGYIDPNGDFDFNVVIRSLLYSHALPYLSARVGSAITIHAHPEKEYEECLIKSNSLFESLK